MNTNDLITKELTLINRMFQQSKVMAKVTTQQTIVVEVGYISYGLTLALSEKFQRVEALQRELSALVTSNRQRAGLDASAVIPVSTPRLALEVAHPSPKPLLWSPRKVTNGQPHTMAIGRSYLARPKDETISFDSTPHILIAGITGAGKSVLLQTMLLSLCAATAPTDLRLVLVDLKNEDLVPFEKLPHTLTFAGTKAAAVDVIRFVVDEKNKRIEQRGYKPYRLVLVVDEMAQLAGDGEVRDMLGDLASIGRSKWINMIGATQSVTEKGGLGALLKANFAVRLVGQVAPGMSYVATGRPQTHADLLPGKGAFLRCEGARVERFQSYYIDANDVALMAKYISKDLWGGVVMEPVMKPSKGGYEPVMQPVITGYGGGYDRLHTSGSDTRSITGYESTSIQFPVSEGRPLTEQEAQSVRTMAGRGDFDTNGKFSMNRAVLAVYGSKEPKRLGWVKAALEAGTDAPTANDDSKIIQLRRAS